jgi:hypothetical protein
MKTKRVLCPERLRHVPHQFSWIDQPLVREGHIARCGPAALALYLLLVTVADAQGLSYYSDKTAARLLSLSETGQLGIVVAKAGGVENCESGRTRPPNRSWRDRPGIPDARRYAPELIRLSLAPASSSEN